MKGFLFDDILQQRVTSAVNRVPEMACGFESRLAG